MKREFFERNSVIVAKELIGKVLIVRNPQTSQKWFTRIVETEAYRTTDSTSLYAELRVRA